MNDAIATWDNANILPEMIENGSNQVYYNWLLPDRKEGLSVLRDNLVSFDNDYQGLKLVSSIDVTNASDTEIAFMLKYNSYELFMIRVLGSIALAFAVFVTSVKAFKGIRSRMKGGKL